MKNTGYTLRTSDDYPKISLHYRNVSTGQGYIPLHLKGDGGTPVWGGSQDLQFPTPGSPWSLGALPIDGYYPETEKNY